MLHTARRFAACALAATLAACAANHPSTWHPHPRPRPEPAAPVVAPPAPVVPLAPVAPPAAAPAAPTPRELAAQRLHQVDTRIDDIARAIDDHVRHGDYSQADGAALHHRLEAIREEAHDMASHHGDGLTPGEQRVMNEELDTAARAARQ